MPDPNAVAGTPTQLYLGTATIIVVYGLNSSGWSAPPPYQSNFLNLINGTWGSLNVDDVVAVAPLHLGALLNGQTTVLTSVLPIIWFSITQEAQAIWTKTGQTGAFPANSFATQGKQFTDPNSTIGDVALLVVAAWG